MDELALFAGAGGGILGGRILGWRTRCAVEIDAYARRVLFARQRDGMLEPFPVWDDVRTFDGKPWRGHIDVVSGGFPCTDISSAKVGAKGLAGTASGLWSEFARIIGEVGPEWVFVENSPLLSSRGLDVVLRDLASLGFDAEWGVLGAWKVGAPHRRDRMWIVAHSKSNRREQRAPEHKGCEAGVGERTITKPSGLCCLVSDAGPQGLQEREQGTLGTAKRTGELERHDGGGEFKQWEVEPAVCRVVNGLAYRVDRLKCIGNGQVPLVAATAFTLLQRRFMK